jgi:hypothetical protein
MLERPGVHSHTAPLPPVPPLLAVPKMSPCESMTNGPVGKLACEGLNDASTAGELPDVLTNQ